MTGHLLILPIAIPLFTTIACLLAWPRPRLRLAISAVGAAALFVGTVLVFIAVQREDLIRVAIGGWPPPVGIALVADRLSAVMLLVVGSIGLLISIHQLGRPPVASPLAGTHETFHILLMGVGGAFLAGDLFNLYVWFEVMLIGSFVLMAWGGGSTRLVGSLKYVTLNLVSSAIFLAAIGLLYARFGTLNLADLARIQMDSGSTPDRGRFISLLFLASFGIKAGMFPFFFWLPDSYPNAPAVIGGLFAALLTKVGVYSLLRVFTLVFPEQIRTLQIFLMFVAAMTMILGVFGAMAQEEIRRILSFHIISQIGYMIMGLALFTPLAIAGTIYFLLHNIVAKTNLFLIGGVVEELNGSSELHRLGGVLHRHGVLGMLFLVSSLSLAGLPPLAGFWAKLVLIIAGFREAQYAIVAAAIFVSLLTLYSMMKIWTRVFWGPSPPAPPLPAGPPEMSSRFRQGVRFAPIFVLAAAAVLLGIFVEPVLNYCLGAAEQLLYPQAYVEGVLAAQP